MLYYLVLLKGGRVFPTLFYFLIPAERGIGGLINSFML